MHAVKRLRIAYTPDSDDAFYYHALETGQVCLPGYELEFHRQPMSVLNRAVLHGLYEVTAISSVVYPQIATRYAVLSVGTSVGRGYGPVLVGRRPSPLEDLAGRRVGVPGIPTTGWFLLRCFCPEAVAVEMAFDRIAGAVADGHLEAGVMIHEELLYYPRLGLHRVLDLGAEWCRRNGLPLPVGLNVVRRDLGAAAMQHIAAAIHRSLRHALNHPRPALAGVSRLGRGVEGQCTERFVAMFANQDSLCMPPTCAPPWGCCSPRWWTWDWPRGCRPSTSSREWPPRFKRKPPERPSEIRSIPTEAPGRRSSGCRTV
jgi:1,4-dihydroxy-6-naphthoate synthase